MPKLAAKTEKKAVATKTNEAKKEDKGLRKPQVRILAALAKAKQPLIRKEIAEKSEVDYAWLVEHIGSSDDAKRKANDEKHFPSLVTRGLVKPELKEGQVAYVITAAGRKAHDKA